MKRLRPGKDTANLPKAGRAYSILRDAIISMRFAPGEVLNEKEICVALDASRTPFREAAQRLAAEGLVRVVPSDATYVNLIIVEDVIQGMMIRQTLELRTVVLAARCYTPAADPDFELVLFRQAAAVRKGDQDAFFQQDNAFHSLMCDIAGFPRVWEAVKASNGQVERVRRRTLNRPGLMQEALEEHRAIFEALRCHDAARARALLEGHLDDILRALRIVMGAEPDYVAGPDAAERLQALLEVK